MQVALDKCKFDGSEWYLETIGVLLPAEQAHFAGSTLKYLFKSKKSFKR